MEAAKFRVEKDSLGNLPVPSGAYYGIFTQRAKQNFRISGIGADRNFIKALCIIKKAAAVSNTELGILDRKIADAIAASADEVIAGKWDSEFPLDVFQAGAGTPFNMNANEVIANLSIEKLGGRKGDYVLVHPNNHVNMAQSSNDVIPTCARIAVLFTLQPLFESIAKITLGFKEKAEEFKGVAKTGRTHLEDAVPIRFEQVFNSYANSLANCIASIKNAEKSLRILGIGGTAVGTGINTHPEFKLKIVRKLSEYTCMDLSVAPDSVLTTWSAAPFLETSAALRMLATEVIKICNDLMLLNSGPKTGIAEIILPEVEPGSSIMPGKINPSIPECAVMVCYQVIGNDAAVSEAARAGQMELNVMTPVIAFDLIWSARIMANALIMLQDRCISQLKVDAKRTRELLEKGLSLATSLNPYTGYDVAAEIVKMALNENKSLPEVLVQQGIMQENDIKKILDTKAMTEPGLADQNLVKKIRESQSFKKFKESMTK